VQNELVVFIGKVMNIFLTLALFWLEMTGHIVIKSAELQAPKLFGSYVDWRKQFVAKDSACMDFMEETIFNAMKENGTDKDWNGKIDKQEYSVMLMALPLWTQAYFAKEIQPALKLLPPGEEEGPICTKSA
jgi:hypothetical protein